MEGDWEIFQSVGRHKLFSLSNVIWRIRLGRVGWAGNVARNEENRVMGMVKMAQIHIT